MNLDSMHLTLKLMWNAHTHMVGQICTEKTNEQRIQLSSNAITIETTKWNSIENKLCINSKRRCNGRLQKSIDRSCWHSNYFIGNTQKVDDQVNYSLNIGVIWNEKRPTHNSYMILSHRRQRGAFNFGVMWVEIGKWFEPHWGG